MSHFLNTFCDYYFYSFFVQLVINQNFILISTSALNSLLKYQKKASMDRVKLEYSFGGK